VDPYNPAKRKHPARARQRQQASSSAARRRHTQQPAGGIAARKRDEERAARQRAETESTESERSSSAGAMSGVALRDRLQSGATATMSAVGERVRRAAQFGQDARRRPLARPSTWIVEPSWYERIHDWLADLIPFSWRERARRRGYWRRKALPIIAIIACLTVGLTVGFFALKTAGNVAGVLAANSAPPQATNGGSVMISPLNNISTTPTPTLPQYDVGVWVSDTLPQGGSVTVFARVSNNSQAQPQAKVYFSAVTPRGVVKIGPFTTDSYGVASGKLNYGNVGGQKPIYLTATTSIGGQTYTGEYTFVTFG
jgi:hypothetical protein